MSKPENKKRKRKTRAPLFSFVTFVLLSLGIAVMAITPQSYSYASGDVAMEDIPATREVTDELTTNERKLAAREAVPIRYVTDQALTVEIEDNINAYFDAISEIRLRAPDLLAERQRQSDLSFNRQFVEGEEHSKAPTLTYEDLSDEDFNVLLSLLPADTMESATPSDIIRMIEADENDINMATMFAKDYISTELQEGIKESDLQYVKDSIYDRLQKVLSDKPDLVEIARMSTDFMKANSLPNEEVTEDERKAAEDAVVPVTYKKGQNIIRKGEVITDKQIEILRTLGMLRGGINVRMYISAFLSVLACAAACIIFATIFNRTLLTDWKQITLCGIMVIVNLAITALLVHVDIRLIPIALVPLVISLTIDHATASIIGIISCCLSSVIMVGAGVDSKEAFAYMLTGLMASPVAAISAYKFNSRVGIMVAGIIAGLTAGSVSTIMLLQAGVETRAIVQTSAFYLLSGVISSILCVGSTPIWETIFNALTPTKLMELCNSNNYLLKKLALEAPGTYHHSTMVANLSEAAAEAIGANSLLARAGAYYHDIGKLKAPSYYKENQTAENPHDFLAPEESARIISMHTVDGAKMIRDARLPEAIAEIAEQHHGTYIMGYFYQTALNRYGEVNQADYRHIGGLPTSKEAAIVMMADSVEAAVRADSTNYLQTIHKLIFSRLEDGQLNKAPITLLDLDKISAAFDGVLKGAYHNRIKYPEAKKPEVKKAEAAGMLPNSNE